MWDKQICCIIDKGDKTVQPLTHPSKEDAIKESYDSARKITRFENVLPGFMKFIVYPYLKDEDVPIS